MTETDDDSLIRGYILATADDEIVLVIRSYRFDLLFKILKRMKRMRQSNVSDLGKALKEELHALYRRING